MKAKQILKNWGFIETETNVFQLVENNAQIEVTFFESGSIGLDVYDYNTEISKRCAFRSFNAIKSQIMKIFCKNICQKHDNFIKNNPNYCVELK